MQERPDNDASDVKAADLKANVSNDQPTSSATDSHSSSASNAEPNTAEKESAASSNASGDASADAALEASGAALEAAGAAAAGAADKSEAGAGSAKTSERAAKGDGDAQKDARMRERAAKEHAGFDPNAWRECISFKYLGAWIALGILAIFAYIPNRIRDLFAIILSFALYKVNIKFKRIIHKNLETVYPQYSYGERETIYRKFLTHCFISFMSYGEPLFLPKWLLALRWKVKNKDVLDAAKATGKPIIFCSPHFVHLDRCGLYMSYSGLPMFAMVNDQKNKLFNWFINYQRIMFGGTIHTRKAGFRSIIRALRFGQNAFVLFDEDMGDGHPFVPFCGVPKSTVDVLSRLVASVDAVVLVTGSSYNLATANYEIEYVRLDFTKEETVAPPNELDLEAMKDEAKLKEFVYSIDITRKPYERMVQELSQKLLPKVPPYLERFNDIQSEMIHAKVEQYMWFLRIFKTLPDNRYFRDIYHELHLSDGNKVDPQDRVEPTNEASGKSGFNVDYEPFVKARAMLKVRYEKERPQDN